jgi:hypothetical protein
MADDAMRALNDKLSMVAPALDHHLNPDMGEGGIRRVGFLLVAFEFGPAGTPLAFISNAERASLKSVIRELLERIDNHSHEVTLTRETT